MRVALIHALRHSPPPIEAAFRAEWPDAVTMNLLDDSLSADLAREGWAEVKRALAAERYEFLLLDEMTYPVKWGWIDVEDVVETLRDRPGFQHVVITGRDAVPELIEAADLVSEVVKVKHPFDEGIRAQQGIEW